MGRVTDEWASLAATLMYLGIPAPERSKYAGNWTQAELNKMTCDELSDLNHEMHEFMWHKNATAKNKKMCNNVIGRISKIKIARAKEVTIWELPNGHHLRMVK